MAKIDFDYFAYIWQAIKSKLEEQTKTAFTIEQLQAHSNFGHAEIELMISKLEKGTNLDPKAEIKLSVSTFNKITDFLALNSIAELHDSFLISQREKYDIMPFVGRNNELKVLNEFLTGPKKIFALYGVPMIGKSALINELKARTTDEKFLFTHIELPPGLDCLQAINDSLFNDAIENNENENIIVIENFEELLEWHGNELNIHGLKETYKSFANIIQRFISVPNFKFILVSRFQINFSEMAVVTNQVERLPEIELKGIAPEYFWPYYKHKNIKKQDFDRIYSNFNGHTALLSTAFNKADWIYDNNLHNVLTKPLSTTKLIWNHISSLFKSLTKTEIHLIAFLALTKAPVKTTVLYQYIQELEQIGRNVFDELLFSIRKKFLCRLSDDHLSINPYIKEISFTYLSEHKASVIQELSQVDYIKNYGLKPQYDPTLQALEKGDYGAFYKALKKARRSAKYTYVHNMIKHAKSTDSIINKVGLMNEEAITFKEQSKFEEAIEVLLQAEQIDPHNGKILNEIGINYKNLNQIEKAITYFKKGVALKNLPSYTELALLLHQKGDEPEAIMILEQAVKLKNIPSYTELAKIHYNNNRAPEAIDLLKEALTLDTKDIININLLAKMLTENHREEELIALYKEAEIHYPNQFRNKIDKITNKQN